MTGTLYGTVHTTHQNANFIIHEAILVPGLPTNAIELMGFCISFLGENGEPNENIKWI